MAPPGFENTSLFERAQISSVISADDAPGFFEKYGVFYQANAEIGRVAITLGNKAVSRDDINLFKPIFMQDLRLQSILAPFIEGKPAFCFTLGSDAGNFYALATVEDPHPRAVIYIWTPEAQLEFAHGSHIGSVKGVPASNGLMHIPYINLSKTRKLQDVSISLEEGGM
ncbi:hypothetical protein HIM_09983 [Hirsutella minnesotensis 3608]|uniref:Uncharacterized protein n=1 Tax=Hirsutella minnesotensis 3608 TaxID=1043627 RepID=A0A0F7ZS26_9HYPO|nr:hypothetical protein HIM_09983 [Hirsutella minnesotensis 3608]